MAADKKEMAANRERIETSILLTISVRKSKVEQLFQHLDAMSQPNANFIRGLEYKSRSYDAAGRHGGRLAELSEQQVVHFDALHQEYVLDLIPELCELEC